MWKARPRNGLAGSAVDRPAGCSGPMRIGRSVDRRPGADCCAPWRPIAVAPRQRAVWRRDTADGLGVGVLSCRTFDAIAVRGLVAIYPCHEVVGRPMTGVREMVINSCVAPLIGGIRSIYGHQGFGEGYVRPTRSPRRSQPPTSALANHRRSRYGSAARRVGGRRPWRFASAWRPTRSAKPASPL